MIYLCSKPAMPSEMDGVRYEQQILIFRFFTRNRRTVRRIVKEVVMGTITPNCSTKAIKTYPRRLVPEDNLTKA